MASAMQACVLVTMDILAVTAVCSHASTHAPVMARALQKSVRHLNASVMTVSLVATVALCTVRTPVMVMVHVCCVQGRHLCVSVTKGGKVIFAIQAYPVPRTAMGMELVF
jgi:hypothetical protein